MDFVEQSGSHLEFSSHFGWAARALFVAAGLLPLWAPYDLLMKPAWHGDLNPVRWFFLLISAGAIVVSFLVISFALLALNQRIRFDCGSRVITYGSRATLIPYREERYPFSAIEALHVKAHHWTEGPPTYNISVKLAGRGEIEFGHFPEQDEAERYRSVLERLVSRSPC